MADTAAVETPKPIKVLSVDVGIVHLAVCICSYIPPEDNAGNEAWKIHYWEVIHLQSKHTRDAGFQMIAAFENRPVLHKDIDAVLVESQAGSSSRKMNALALAIQTYFATRKAVLRALSGDHSEPRMDQRILTVSAKHKLRVYQGREVIPIRAKNAYTRRKRLGIEHTKRMLKQLGLVGAEKWFLSLKKQDDAADAMLQGFYWTKADYARRSAGLRRSRKTDTDVGMVLSGISINGGGVDAGAASADDTEHEDTAERMTLVPRVSQFRRIVSTAPDVQPSDVAGETIDEAVKDADEGIGAFVLLDMH
jgi:hypothetical protein